MSYRRVVLGAGLILAAGAAPAAAQWTSDPAAPFVLSDAAGDQNQPKIRAIPGGGFYVSWLSTQGTGWDTWVQRVDANGVPQWASNGLNVADTNFSSTEDYGLAVDADGNALIAFRDDHTGITQIGLQKVTPAGDLPWGPYGVTVSAATVNGDVHTPSVCVTSDGSYVVGYTRGSPSRAWFQKVDAAGNKLWNGGAGVTIVPTANGYTAAPTVASDNGHVIVTMFTSGSFTVSRQVHAQKLDGATGAQLWNGGAPVPVQTTSTLQIGNFPTVIPDGNGGALIAWYDTPNGAFQARVQHLDSAGVAQFPVNGAVGATTAGRLRVSPSIAYDAAADETYMFYSELNSTQSEAGVYGQKFDADGNRLWGEAGVEVTPLTGGGQVPSFIRTTLSTEGAIVSFFEGTNASATTHVVKAAKVAADGTLEWSPGVITVNSNSGAAKTRQENVEASGGGAVIVYGDGAGGSLDIVSSRINADGTIGNPETPSCPADADGNGLVEPADVAAFVNTWFGSLTGGTLEGDFDQNGAVEPADVAAFVTAWFNALTSGC